LRTGRCTHPSTPARIRIFASAKVTLCAATGRFSLCASSIIGR
jgi:hypothetical protein